MVDDGQDSLDGLQRPVPQISPGHSTQSEDWGRSGTELLHIQQHSIESDPELLDRHSVSDQRLEVVKSVHRFTSWLQCYIADMDQAVYECIDTKIDFDLESWLWELEYMFYTFVKSYYGGIDKSPTLEGIIGEEGEHAPTEGSH